MTALLSLLQNIQQTSQQLYDCLMQEKLALDENQLEGLIEISSHKQALVEKLNQLDKQRAASTTEKDFNAFIANSKNQALINQWQLTRKVIASCQQQNEINGRLINKRSQMNHDVLCILSGRNQPADETYNAQGNQAGNASLLSGIKA